MKTMGSSWLPPWPRMWKVELGVAITAAPSANQIGCQHRQSIDLTLRPAVFDRHVLAFDIAGGLEALAKCAQTLRPLPQAMWGLRNPISELPAAVRCATSGHVAAALPNKRDELTPSHVLLLKPRITPYHIVEKAVLCITAFWPARLPQRVLCHE